VGLIGHVGIPVSIGIAPTKVLAKIATEIVKYHPEYDGVLDMVQMSQEERDDLLSKVSIEDVWGIGRKSVIKLQLQGKIFTVKQLRDADLVEEKCEQLIMSKSSLTCSEKKGGKADFINSRKAIVSPSKKPLFLILIVS